MKKKVVVLILALFMLIPVSGVFAEEIIKDNLLIDRNAYYSTNLDDALNMNGEVIKNITDGSYSTKHEFETNNSANYVYIPFEFRMPRNKIISYKSSFSYLGIPSSKINLISDGEIVDSSSFYRNDEVYIASENDIEIDGVLLDLKFNSYPNISELELFYDSSYDPMAKEVSNIEYNVDKDSIEIMWQMPDGNFTSKITFDNETYITDKNNYKFNDLKSSTEYEIHIFTIDEYQNESNGVRLILTTDSIEKNDLSEIKEVNAEASHDRVDLSWSLPETEYFEHVNIYRKSVSEVQTFSLLSTDEYDPLFETNGTYFNDLTVEEQTTYDYKLTTEFQGLESEGVTVQATTLVAPPPDLGGQEFEEQENGDYLVTWQQPETGQVRILVDGQEYVVVPASDKQYTIPAADMKYSALGDPLVSLQTIGDNGEESEIVDSGSNIDLPFGVGELIETSAGLMKVIGSLILLGLSFILVPKFIKMIKQSLSSKKNERERIEREQRLSERAYRETRESRISTREGRTSTRVPREFRKGE